MTFLPFAGAQAEPTADDAFIERAVASADPIALRAALYQLTGDPELAAMKLAADEVGPIPRPVLTGQWLDCLRSKAAGYLRSHRNAPAASKNAPSAAIIKQIMDMCSLGPVAASFVGAGTEELALVPNPRGVSFRSTGDAARAQGFHVLVIGSGLSGICAAVQLDAMGIPFSVVDKNPGIGGTWFENTYPDARVDVPVHHYSFTFAAHYDWNHRFAPQGEINDYLNAVVDRFQLRDRISFDHEVIAAAWDQDRGVWSARLRRSNGTEETRTANAIISSVGMLNRPKLPDIPGLDTFTGAMFHTARWDHGFDHHGKRVAVVGTGSSGLQVAPRLAKDVAQLDVYQRSPAWLLSVPGYQQPFDEELRWLHARLPEYVSWSRFVLWHGFTHPADLIYQADEGWDGKADPNSRSATIRKMYVERLRKHFGHDHPIVERLVPAYPPYSRRPVMDNGWLDSLKRDNVELVSNGIERILPDGIKALDGTERAYDLIVLASGFHAERYLWPMVITGRDGKTLEDAWSKDGARAHLGITVPGFPNLFMLYGPNTNPRSGSPCTMSELQVRYTLKCLREVIERRSRSIEVKQEVHDEYNQRVDEILANSAWMHEDARSYMRSEKFNRVVTNMPWRGDRYWEMTETPDFSEFFFAGEAPPSAPTESAGKALGLSEGER